nr:translation initiation factor IF-2-like [Aegilops tauschii subsp. strangulata]
MAQALALSATGDSVVPPVAPPSPIKPEPEWEPSPIERYSWTGVVREWVRAPPVWMGATPAQEAAYLEHWRTIRVAEERRDGDPAPPSQAPLPLCVACQPPPPPHALTAPSSPPAGAPGPAPRRAPPALLLPQSTAAANPTPAAPGRPLPLAAARYRAAPGCLLVAGGRTTGRARRQRLGSPRWALVAAPVSPHAR